MKESKTGGDRATSTRIRVAVSTKVLGEAKPEDLAKGVAYAFSKGGALLGRANLNQQGTAALELRMPTAETPQSLRVVIGPDIKEREVSIAELMRRGGEEAFARIDPGVTQKDVLVTIVPEHILCWLLSACVVRGRVLKKVVSGGIPMDLPVCDAIVEVYEVDSIPVLIPKLPDEVIEGFRDIIINPPPPPPPDPRPFQVVSLGGNFPPPPLPIVVGERPQGEHLMLTERAHEGISFTRLESPSAEGGTFAAPRSDITTMAMGEDFQALRTLARSTNTAQFRQVLVDNAALVRHVICLLPFGTIHMDLVATAKTDECGKFKTIFFRGCNNQDTPDLYFKVKQKIFKFFPPFTIYAPTPVSCYTFWNYQCGTQEVTLHVTHPLAITCPPCPNVDAPLNWVLFMAIGNLPLSRIRGTSVSLAGTTTTDNLGLTEGDAPFGELLRPRIEFDNSLREELGVKYYQVSYRKGTSGPFAPLTASINRHYTHEVGGDLILEVYNLGPKVVGSVANLFEIPPALPPVGQWSIPDAVEDTASAKFQTLVEAPLEAPGVAWTKRGIYQLKVDLFDATGNLVDIGALNIKFRVPTSTDFSGTIYTEDAANSSLTNGGADPGTGLVRDDDGDGKKSMIIALHIDNSLCKAEIPAPTLDGTPASDDCGVMTYNPSASESVTISYRPEHPSGVGTEGFATYRFGLFRGANELTLPPSPPPPSIPDSGRTPRPPTTLSSTHSVADLLGSCTVAGFAEHLHVWAMATTGWRRIHEYDAEAVRAFVLAPPFPPGPPGP